MELEDQWVGVLKNLLSSNSAEALIAGQPLTFHISQHVNKYLISVPVYQGINYIPLSVYQSIYGPTPFDPADFPNVHTYLKIDEDKFQINLYYLGNIEDLSLQKLDGILEDFLCMADEWRRFLEERGQQDLVPIYVIPK